jgi:hypothetical protein
MVTYSRAVALGGVERLISRQLKRAEQAEAALNCKLNGKDYAFTFDKMRTIDYFSFGQKGIRPLIIWEKRIISPNINDLACY